MSDGTSGGFWSMLFSYSEGLPLTFTQLFFWGFFVVVLAGFSLTHKRRALRNAWLFFASLFFYYKTSGLFVLILLFSTVSDYSIALMIHSTTSLTLKRLWLALSVSVNLSLLCYFKYAHFFIGNINNAFGTHYIEVNYFALWSNEVFGSAHMVDRILLPVGISFFTFQAISYAVDVYRDHIPPVRSILDFGFFVSFFPQLVAGPIVRAADFIPQLLAPYNLARRDFGLAVFWILNGLVKMVVIGDYIALNFIDRVFDDPVRYSGFECVMALFAYSLQVYADFSGYTDIAIGVALLMGFRLATNFNSPYKATHVGEFWKRWHMSLSTWLRDYLYIPLGGNRGATVGTWVCLSALVMVAVLLS
jgi:alginate O-acetyltransferase complex protein AlgI